jgi:hypothetical protein
MSRTPPERYSPTRRTNPFILDYLNSSNTLPETGDDEEVEEHLLQSPKQTGTHRKPSTANIPASVLNTCLSETDFLHVLQSQNDIDTINVLIQQRLRYLDDNSEVLRMNRYDSHFSTTATYPLFCQTWDSECHFGILR